MERVNIFEKHMQSQAYSVKLIKIAALKSSLQIKHASKKIAISEIHKIIK